MIPCCLRPQRTRRNYPCFSLYRTAVTDIIFRLRLEWRFLPQSLSCELLRFSQLPPQYDLNDFALQITYSDQRRFLLTEATPVDNRHSRTRRLTPRLPPSTLFLLPEADKTGFRRPSCGGKRSVCRATLAGKTLRQSFSESCGIPTPLCAEKPNADGFIPFISRYAVQSRPAYRFCSSPLRWGFQSVNLFRERCLPPRCFPARGEHPPHRLHAAAASPRRVSFCRVALKAPPDRAVNGDKSPPYPPERFHRHPPATSIRRNVSGPASQIAVISPYRPALQRDSLIKRV